MKSDFLNCKSNRNVTDYKVLIITFFIFLTPFFKSVAADNQEDSLGVFRTPSVTVTADRAVVGKSPVPFSNLTKTDIQQTYIMKDVPELLTALPSIISYSENGNNVGYSYLTMRGFSQHRISVFVNGIPQNDPEDHNVYWIDMPDIASNVDNIQVQRGAGIVNYGAASIGGSINLTTSNFVNQRGVKVFSGIGYQEYGSGSTTVYQPTMSKLSFEVSSGVVGKYAVYGRLSKINSNGYRDNAWAYMNSYYLGAVRFDDNFTTQINIFGGPLTDGLAYTGLPKEYIKDLKLRRTNPSYWEYNSTGDTVSYYVNRIPQEMEGFSQPHYEMLNDWFISDKLSFHSSLFYYQGDGYFDYGGAGWADGYWWDGAWSNGPLKDWMSNDYKYPADTLSTKNSILRGTVANKHGGWIPRITWKHDGGELSAGAEIRIHRSEHWGKIIYSDLYPSKVSDGSAYDPDYKFYDYNGKRDIFSLFASEQYHLTGKLTLSVEGQLVNQRYTMSELKQGYKYMEFIQSDGSSKTGEGDLFAINYIFFNPRLGFNYLLQDNMNVYAMAALTSREPRMSNLFAGDQLWNGANPQFESDTINGQIGYDFTKPIVKPESMLDIELGWNYKTENYNVNVNGYWMEYFDELVSSGVVDIWGRPVDGNVPRTRHIGLELQGSTILMKNSSGQIILSANATISQNKIADFDFVTLKYDDNYNKVPADTVSLAGNSIAGFPDIMGGLRLDYTLDNFYCGAAGRFVGGFRTDNFGDKITDPAIQNHLITITDIYSDNKFDPYFVMNADFSYTFKDILSLQTLKIQAKVNNLLNNIYASYGIGKMYFPAAERNFFIGIELGL